MPGCVHCFLFGSVIAGWQEGLGL